jgi:hypothetical protein
MNCIPAHIRKVPLAIAGRLLALPDDVNLADVDWSPVNAAETATAPHHGRIASPDKHGRGKRQPHTDTQDNKARRPKTHSRSMASDKQQATCPVHSLAAQVKGSKARLVVSRGVGASIFVQKAAPNNHAPSPLCAFPVRAANGI